MTVPTTRSSRPAEGDSTHKNPGLRRALFTSSVGSALEYYDFAIYGTASALVFTAGPRSSGPCSPSPPPR
ncbi:hypothetical protein [Streptomyces sp. NPDC002788]